ncbi:hypothetical protein CYK37_16050 [Mesorhizobium loti]|nr:TetR family transcriptional regulator [Mesorhizobium loti]PLP58408.1 hypothetical protein CYK37_16050 [Mesorhizobium loti]
MTVASRSKPASLDEKRVLDAAFRTLDAHGFSGLTIRRIADELGVKNPALYWHFKNKQEIIDGMAGRLLDNMTTGDGETPDNWRVWLEEAAQLYRRALFSVRDGAEVLSNANLSRSRHFAEFSRHIEFFISQGFTTRDATVGMVTVFNYTLGMTYEQQADANLAVQIDAADRTLVAPMGVTRVDIARDELFKSGLEVILDGLALRHRS